MMIGLVGGARLGIACEGNDGNVQRGRDCDGVSGRAEGIAGMAGIAPDVPDGFTPLVIPGMRGIAGGFGCEGADELDG